MEVKFNVTGNERKELVTTIAEIIGDIREFRVVHIKLAASQ